LPVVELLSVNEDFDCFDMLSKDQWKPNKFLK